MAKVRDEFWVDLKGKRYPTWPGVLIAMHEEGLIGIEVTALQYPTAENGMVAICQATVTMRGDGTREQIYTEIADACPSNVNPRMAGAVLRLAATRAKGRAGRDAIALGDTLLEELPGDEEMERPNGHRVANGQNAPRPKASEETDRSSQLHRDDAVRLSTAQAPVCSVAGCGAFLTESEFRGSRKHFGDELFCHAHGREKLLAMRAEAEAAAAAA